MACQPGGMVWGNPTEIPYSPVPETHDMTLLTSVRIALKALGRHKLRSALTMLGIVIGVAAVLTMVAVGHGAQASVEEEVKSTGTPLITVTSGNYSVPIGSASILAAWEFASLDPSEPRPLGGRGAATTLTPADARAIRAEVEGVKYKAAHVMERAFISAGDRKHFTKIEGTNVEFPLMHSWTWRSGRFFGAEHVASNDRVATIGAILSAKLFGRTVDPVGRTIEIRGQSFEVLGVAESAVGDQAESAFVPFTTLQEFLGITHLHGIGIAADSAGNTTRIAGDIRALLRARHGLDAMNVRAIPLPEMEADPGSYAPELDEDEGLIPVPDAPVIEEPDDFTIRTQAAAALTKGLTVTATAFVMANLAQLDNVTLDELRDTLSEANTTMTALLASIAGVSLLVGGIGIMNIMLVSVTERTQEIGLRMTVGARNRDVLMQFLVEAVTLSIFGGVIGIVVGFVAAEVVARTLEWQTAVSASSVVIAFAIAATIGVFFGFYPAHKASRLDPVIAVRYE